MKEFIIFLFGFWFGGIVGIFLLCLIQINGDDKDEM